MFLTRNEYYYNYYKNKKHEYRERYARAKIWEQEKEEMFKPYGGEKEYYREKYNELCRKKNVDINKDDKCETLIQPTIQTTEGKVKHKKRGIKVDKDTSINTK
jgi:hypothetical protein